MFDWYEADFLTREEIHQRQLSRLPDALERAKQSPHYAAALEGVSGTDVRELTDLRKLPFTTKADLRRAMPWGMLAVPRAQVVRMHYSSGTTGLATAIFHTRRDLQWWAECVARGMVGVGVTPDDVFQDMMNYGLFTGGLGLHYAAELIGCLTIPAGAGNTLSKRPGGRLDLVAICRAAGIPSVEVINPRDLGATEAALRRAMDSPEAVVVIARCPCVNVYRERQEPRAIGESRCVQCGICLRTGFPAITARATDDPKTPQPVIDAGLCVGCSLCAQAWAPTRGGESRLACGYGGETGATRPQPGTDRPVLQVAAPRAVVPFVSASS